MISVLSVAAISTKDVLSSAIIISGGRSVMISMTDERVQSFVVNWGLVIQVYTFKIIIIYACIYHLGRYRLIKLYYWHSRSAMWVCI